MAKQKAGFSVRTKDATEGGGISGALATITSIGNVEEFTYGGRFKNDPQAALEVVYEIEGFEKPWEQHYSYGKSKNFEVVADGDGIRGLGKQAGLNKGCAAFKFFEAVEEAAEEAGIDIDELLPEIEDEGVHSVRELEGKQVRLKNVKFETVGGDEKDLVVISTFEEDAPKGKKGKSGSSDRSASTSGKKGGKVNVEEKTEAAVISILEDKTSVKKGDLPQLVYQANRKDEHAKAMMELAFRESWIADDERPWDYDKKKGILRTKDDS